MFYWTIGEFPLKKEPNPPPAPKSADFFKENWKWRTKIDIRLTRVSLGVERHSTVLLAHTKIFERLVLILYLYIFLVLIEDKVILQPWLRRKIAEKCLDDLTLL